MRNGWALRRRRVGAPIMLPQSREWAQRFLPGRRTYAVAFRARNYRRQRRSCRGAACVLPRSPNLLREGDSRSLSQSGKTPRPRPLRTLVEY